MVVSFCHHHHNILTFRVRKKSKVKTRVIYQIIINALIVSTTIPSAPPILSSSLLPTTP
jgi:hypothetical protein